MRKYWGELLTEYMTDIFRYEVLENNSNIYLIFASSDESLEQIRHGEIGRTALFTDRCDLTNDEIVNEYRSACHVESFTLGSELAQQIESHYRLKKKYS